MSPHEKKNTKRFVTKNEQKVTTINVDDDDKNFKYISESQKSIQEPHAVWCAILM